MITELDEAIAHAREKAEEQRKKATAIARAKEPFYKYAECKECAKDHEQLAAWLTELQERREADRWIPVSERLPDNSENEGQLCERVSVMTRYGVTEGWYNPDFKTWFVLVWYMGRTFDSGTGDIDFKRADDPKVVDDVEVIAWKPLPKPYESEDK